ncbi:MAG: sulfite exporter TauE/SafE family protein [Clostridia bacterium]|nr:sulfite exporter TauE/SafE family protein [Clostridia bacterium]
MNITALLAGLFSGVIASMGMGGGAVLLIYLTVFTSTAQLAAQGINLIFFIPIGILSLIIYTLKKQIEWRRCLPLALFGVVGAFLGIYLSGVISGEWLSKMFGVFLCILGLKEIFTKDKKGT